MNRHFIDQLEKRMIAVGLADPSEIHGCSPQEVDQLEANLHVEFPLVYREFLLRMGRRAGSVFAGTDVFLGRLPELREYANEILNESSSPFNLPVECHVFLVHQGYVFMYFPTSEGEDPPVYRFVPGDQWPKRTDVSFLEFLTTSVEDALFMKTHREEFRRKLGLD